MVAFMTAAQQLNLLMTDLAAFRREHPTDDVTSALVNTNVDGEALTDTELASFFILLVVAGNETTRNAISHGLLALTHTPTSGRCGRPTRRASPRPASTRSCAGPRPSSGCAAPWPPTPSSAKTSCDEGDKVILFYNSANRDEDVFDDPFTFDVRRTPTPTSASARRGRILPRCPPGPPGDRRDVPPAVRAAARHRGVGEPDRLLSPFINGIKHLDCTFTPVAPRWRPPRRPLAAVRRSANSWKAASARGPQTVPGPPFMEMATPIISATSSVVAPRRARRAMGGDAAVALPGDRDGERDQLLGLGRQGALRQGRLVHRA